MISCISEMQNASKPDTTFNMSPNMKDAFLPPSLPTNLSPDGTVSAQQLVMHQMVAWFQGVQAALSLMPSLLQKPLLETSQMLASQMAAQQIPNISSLPSQLPVNLNNNASFLPFQTALDSLQQNLNLPLKSDMLNFPATFKPAFNTVDKAVDEPLELCKKPKIDPSKVSTLTAFKEPKSHNSSVHNNQSLSGTSIARGSSSDMDSSLSAGDDDYPEPKSNHESDLPDKKSDAVSNDKNSIDERDLTLFYDHLKNRKRQYSSENGDPVSPKGSRSNSPDLKCQRESYDHGYVSEKHKLRAKRDCSANSRRIKANARERSRVHTISAAFDGLRMSVPVVSDNQKLSKLAVLRIASCYIETLAACLEDDNKKSTELPQDLSVNSSDTFENKRHRVPRYKPELTFNDCVKQLNETILMESKIKRS